MRFLQETSRFREFSLWKRSSLERRLRLGYQGLQLFKFFLSDYRLLGVLGEVDQHGSRSTRHGDAEGLCQSASDVFNTVQVEDRPGGGCGNLGDVGFLKGVGVPGGGRYLTGDDHQGNIVSSCVGDRCNGVGGSRTRGDDADSHLAGSSGIAHGRPGGSRLALEKVGANLRVGMDGIQSFHNRATRESHDLANSE